LQARVEGPDGNNIPYTATANAGATEVMTGFTPALCCANIQDAPVTPENPAAPGEFIVVYATGLGLPILDDTVAPLVSTGVQYPVGGPNTQPADFVSSIVGGSTADVISATLLPGTVGEFKVVLHLNSGLLSNPAAPLTIAQDAFVSKVVTLPIQSSGPPQ
jgi:uncharacterized protein (TIGR03437 family)